MYFKEKGNTNIDSEFNDNNKFDIKKFKVPLIIFGIVIILIIGILVLFNMNKGSSSDTVVAYYLTLEGEELITIYRGDEYVDPGYIGRDSLGNDLTDKVVVSSNIDTSIVGDYEVVYTLNDKILTRYISVVDKPVGATSIYLIGDLTMYLDINSEYVEPGYMAIDSVDSTLTDKVIVKNEIDTSKVGTYYVIYSVTNSSGITIQNKRKVIVTDSEITLSLDNTNYTNKDINIDVYVSDNYFNYLILPDGNKINNRSYTYTVSSNGEYKFTSYNKNGKESTGSITVSNIDKEKPQGTCSGSYGDGKSSISIKASDNIGISRYVIDGVSYTSSTITLNKDVSKVSITIYDKAGNTNTISCSLKQSVTYYQKSFTLLEYSHSGGISIQYWLNIPDSARDGMPLVIFLHGDGEINRPDALKKLKPVNFITSEYSGKPFIFIAPITTSADWVSSSRVISLKGLIDKIVKDYKIDSNNIYIMGISRGAIGTWNMVDKYPNFFRAAVPISCCQYKDNKPENFLHTKILAISGNVGENGDAYYNKCMTYFVGDINKVGGNAEKKTYRGQTHSTITAAVDYNEVLSWMFS